MKKTEIREMLQKEIEARHEVHINRDKIDENPINCIPLTLGQDLLLVQYLYDFQIDGYKIIRVKDITYIRSDEVERFRESILKKEGIYDQIKKPSISNLGSWDIAFKELKDLGENIIVECEAKENGKFSLGKIIEVKNNSLLLLRFDAVGEWDQEPTKILFKDITSVTLNNRYITTILKYVKQK